MCDAIHVTKSRLLSTLDVTNGIYVSGYHVAHFVWHNSGV